MPQEQTKHGSQKLSQNTDEARTDYSEAPGTGMQNNQTETDSASILSWKRSAPAVKEIYYKALQKDSSIGPATVYRMVNTLESIGAISRKKFLQDCLWRRMLQRSGLYRRTERSYHLPLKRERCGWT